MDATDLKLIAALQERADTPLSDLARRLKISRTTCWNRLQRLEEDGVIRGRHITLDAPALGLPVTVFLSITVGHHSAEWIERFNAAVAKHDEIIEAHRLTGEGADYQLKIIAPDIESYDAFQQKLIGEINFTSMSTRIALKEIKRTHRLPLKHLQ